MPARNCIFVGIIEEKVSLRAAVSVVQFFRQVMAARTVRAAITSPPGCCVAKAVVIDCSVTVRICVAMLPSCHVICT